MSENGCRLSNDVQTARVAGRREQRREGVFVAEGEHFGPCLSEQSGGDSAASRGAACHSLQGSGAAECDAAARNVLASERTAEQSEADEEYYSVRAAFVPGTLDQFVALAAASSLHGAGRVGSRSERKEANLNRSRNRQNDLVDFLRADPKKWKGLSRLLDEQVEDIKEVAHVMPRLYVEVGKLMDCDA